MDDEYRLDWIEFVGASGVGKTTLFKELSNQRTSNDTWITHNEATIQIAKNLPFDSLLSIRKKIFLAILKQNILKKRSYEFAERVLNDFTEKAFCEIGGRYNLLFEIQLRGILENPEIEPRLKSAMVSFYLKITKEFILFEYHQTKQTVVFDDGILHNNIGLSNLNTYMQHIHDEYTEGSVLEPIGIVFCKSDSSTIFQQVKKREQEQKATMFHKNLNDEQLQKRIAKSIMIANNKIANLKKLDVPILEINTSKNQATNINLINSFIRELSE